MFGSPTIVGWHFISIHDLDGGGILGIFKLDLLASIHDLDPGGIAAISNLDLLALWRVDDSSMFFI